MSLADANVGAAATIASRINQEFPQPLFSQIVRNIKRLDLPSARQRQRVAELGILEFEVITTSAVDQTLAEHDGCEAVSPLPRDKPSGTQRTARPGIGTLPPAATVKGSIELSLHSPSVLETLPRETHNDHTIRRAGLAAGQLPAGGWTLLRHSSRLAGDHHDWSNP